MGTKKTLVLHIGMGKTGTTALQRYFTANRKLLADRGILYPEYGTMVGAHHLLSPHRPPSLVKNWTFKEVNEWAPLLALEAPENVLISSELMVSADSEKVVAFCNSLKKWFDLKIVIYLRRQDDIITASYQQQIKAGTQWHTIDTIFDRKVALYNYERIIEPWSQAAGSENIIVRPYERQQFFHKDICHDFLHHVFSMENFRSFTSTQENPNPRFSRTAREYKRQINSSINDREKNKQFNKLLMQYSAEFDQNSAQRYRKESTLSPEQRLEAIEKNEASNRAVASRYLGREDGRMFLAPGPDPESHWVGNHLSRKEAAQITRYLRNKDRSLIRWLARELRRNKRYKLSAYLDLPFSQFHGVNPMDYLTKPFQRR